MIDQRFSVYFSHSWKPQDVDLNLYGWRWLAEKSCDLFVDANEGEKPHYPPGYYVNRIEEFIRRCDLFFAVLTYREDGAKDNGGLRCSPYSLFEIRLAERARRPRRMAIAMDRSQAIGS